MNSAIPFSRTSFHEAYKMRSVITLLVALFAAPSAAFVIAPRVAAPVVPTVNRVCRAEEPDMVIF